MIGRTPKKSRQEKDGYSRREREIMDVLYRLEEGTAAQILEQIADPPSYTAIRTLLTILEKKGHVRHRVDGPRYVYQPAVAREQMGKRAIQTLLTTFYDNSMERVVAAMIDREEVAPDELDRLAALIAKARKEGR
jgi:BlaI family transcriptional regulator, penicillinase repressor